MPVVETFTEMLQSGASSLASYLAAHVLLCLVPAFFIAGAMTALVSNFFLSHGPWTLYQMIAWYLEWNQFNKPPKTPKALRLLRAFCNCNI